MNTRNKTLMTMSLALMMVFFLSGCAQYKTAGDMDEPMAGQTAEMTGQSMNKDTMNKETEKMEDQSKGAVMKTMKGDTMQGGMESTKDKMINDNPTEKME